MTTILQELDEVLAKIENHRDSAMGYLSQAARFDIGAGNYLRTHAPAIRAALELQARVDAREKAVEDVVNQRGEPDVIWLQVHGEADPADYIEPVDVQDVEVSWCCERIHEHDVMYVRADLAAPPAGGEEG